MKSFDFHLKGGDIASHRGKTLGEAIQKFMKSSWGWCIGEVITIEENVMESGMLSAFSVGEEV